MHLESLTLSGFRGFGSAPCTVALAPGVTAFVGANGAGKTSVMQALQRLFGVTADHRRIRRADFHIPAAEAEPPGTRAFYLEAVLAFPELDAADGDDTVIPEFFHQMAADHEGRLKCRFRLDATWTDDGSLDGLIEQDYRAIRKVGVFEEDDAIPLKATDRARIQLIYVPAARDAASQVTAFLRGRLWRAVAWSEGVRASFAETGERLNTAFAGEPAVDVVSAAVTRRWREVHTAGTDSTPIFQPIDLRFQEFIRKVEVVFRPDEAGRQRALEDLSDGQRSLFHLAMTAATLDIEGQIAADAATAGFQPGGVSLPALTIIAVEEPENSLSPFYLSRIVRQLDDLTTGLRAQALVSSHSASILARVEPAQVRHFRLDPVERTARVREIRLPVGEEEASKFVREAVRTYPELYFARFTVLGEGASEEVVLPRLAQAMSMDIDRSFVAVVPLGGRHVNHLWRLLTDLEVPYATLLDLDWGRSGGGWGRIKTACAQLLATGVSPADLFGNGADNAAADAHLAAFDAREPSDATDIRGWLDWLRRFHVYFSAPLDLDYSMLTALPDAYRVIELGRRGPSGRGDARAAVLGDDGDPASYDASHDDALRWYRYLFLGRGKPGTHVRVLSGQSDPRLAADAPEELRALLGSIVLRLEPDDVLG